MARNAPTGVVIRRGPSKLVCTLGWDRRKDEFKIGQWLRGRIDEHRADLSPDGKYMIYFAVNDLWHREAKGSWTAVSKAPYLKALAMHPQGDCWGDGGLFTSQDSYWLDGNVLYGDIRTSPEVRRDLSFRPVRGVGYDSLGIYFLRLVRDGWTFAGRRNLALAETAASDKVFVFEKPFALGWSLRKSVHSAAESGPGKGCRWDQHELVHPERQIEIPLQNWEWAEVDGERLVWAEGGILRSGKVNEAGLSDAKLLIDLNPMEFEPLVAPY